MFISTRRQLSGLLGGLILTAQCIAQQPVTTKKKVIKESDLPRFTYPVKGTAGDLVQSDPDTFNAFARKVRIDLQSIFDNYDVEDRSTERTLLDAKLSLEEIAGENKEALRTIETIRNLEEKPDARLLSNIIDKAILQARLDSGAGGGPAYEGSFSRHLRQLADALPWNLVQDGINEMKGRAQVGSVSFVVGLAASEFQPSVDRSGGLDNKEAWTLLFFRRILLFQLPIGSTVFNVLQSYVAAHTVVKPDIWQAREVTLGPNRKLYPVLIGIWDAGVDTTVFPSQLYTDPKPGWHDPHGLAFDDEGVHSTSLLYPLTEKALKEYPEFLSLLKGDKDQGAGVDSPEANAFRQKMASIPKEEAGMLFDKFKLYDRFLHGTHVAGIAVRGNPAARLVVFRFNDSLAALNFAPTREWALRMADNFRQIGEFCRTHHVRVVNMSWGDEPSEFEEWLSKSGKGQDPVTRKEQALQLFQIWKAGVSDAIRSAPGTLFICAAGNANANTGFAELVPASLHLDNLMTVGAVNQSGDETSFTSYGDSVIVDANGYNVESFVPGGTKMKLSGTSMASPNVVNLAAKLLALDPSLTPERVIALIKEGATTSDDGRRHLIDERRSVTLLQQADRPN
jgi:subtilisin family serine protease